LHIVAYQFQQLKDVVLESLNSTELEYFLRTLCSNVDSKKQCGRTLNLFTAHMLTSEAVHFIHSIINYDYFLDLSGDIQSFLNEVPEVSETLKSLLHNGTNLVDNFIESDEDSEGNLRYQNRPCLFFCAN